VDNEPSEQRSIEVVKTYYDAFKHFTTLNLATAVGIVTLNELIKLSGFAFVPVLLLFGLSISFALYGLLKSILSMSEENLALGNTTFPNLHGLIIMCVALFALAVVNFVAATLGFEGKFQWLSLVIGLGYVGLWFYQRSRAVG
jgi:hypothetical protein